MNLMKMIAAFLISTLHVSGILAENQSLAEAARKEAERRKQLELRGIEGKVIDSTDSSVLAPSGRVSTSSPPPVHRGESKKTAPQIPRHTLGSYQVELLRLDRQIRQAEDRLTILRARAQTEKRSLPRFGKGTRSGGPGASYEKLQQQIGEQELKLKRLQQERLRVYDTARRAGFLPGEIDGRGIVP